MKHSEIPWATFITFLLAQVGKPYAFGTENDPKAADDSYKSWDCSELVQVAFAKIGITVPDGSYNQAKIVNTVTRDQLQIGDLGFKWYAETGVIHHVGIFIGHRSAKEGMPPVPMVIEAKGKSWGVVLTPADTFMKTPQWAKWGHLKIIQDA